MTGLTPDQKQFLAIFFLDQIFIQQILHDNIMTWKPFHITDPLRGESLGNGLFPSQ